VVCCSRGNGATVSVKCTAFLEVVHLSALQEGLLVICKFVKSLLTLLTHLLCIDWHFLRCID
jgi:hypothetical protein